MCTIGAVFSEGRLNTFKQCDLIPITHFNEPDVRAGRNGVGSYVAMTRQGGRVWAGYNDQGVSFVAADAYTTTAANYYATDDQVNALFTAYEDSISSYRTAPEAAESLANFYRTMGGNTPFPAPDISLITGWADAQRTRQVAIFIEYMPTPFNQSPVRQIVRSDGFFVSTNNFRLQPNAVDYPANHSTYLRLDRAEKILQNDPTLRGVKTLLSDQYYGRTELSICRETDYPGVEFQTQATALFTASRDELMCEYQINGNPANNPLRIFGARP
ncbi:hypothetical protein P0Y43_22435 [Pseudomonas entomophila]|uniref:hypothetical protein n=1 Tax=Pseudomonas entomophila TaxID=312306 RepID=UPI0023D88CC7|nr:hypothetical protein [Pseudomonas entomophila]MDF0733455.1 hypothetical protein [Pseudomonas entomophila]